MNHQEHNFKAQFVDEVFDARVSVHWVDTYYLFLNKYLHGIIMKRGNSWIFAPSSDQDYNSDDILILAEIVETNLIN